MSKRTMSVLCALVLGWVANVGSVAYAAASDRGFVNGQVRTAVVDAGLGETVAGLARQAGRAQWVAWTVPAVDSRRSMCCYKNFDGSDDPRATVCNLESGNHMMGSRDDSVRADGDLRVLLRLADGRIDRVAAFSEGCPLDAGGLQVTLLAGVRPEGSVKLLEEVALLGDGPGNQQEEATMAIAGHGGPAADRALARLAHRDAPRKIRQRAAFWSGASRGEAGLALLRGMLAQERDRSVLEQVVFGISLSKAPGAEQLLLHTARRDERVDVRKKAVFWLSQRAGDRAVAALGEAVRDDPDSEVRVHAVFALSQLPHSRGIPLLIDLARNNRHPEVRRRAIFWLGESGDERALELFEEILAK